MALQASYQQYLARPSQDRFASNASLHYVTSLTSIHGPAAILKHLSVLEQQLKTKSNFLNAFESDSSLCVEAETTMQFTDGGGTYLPGVDDSILFDKTVTILTTHIVEFDKDHKIQQIRLMWDQGSLLKGVEIIGSRGRGWPLRDGKDQVKVVTSSAENSMSSLGSAMNGTSLNDKGRTSRLNSGANAENGAGPPLFGAHDQMPEGSPAHSLGPRASMKPAQRDYQDLFADGAYLPEARDGSPSKVENRNPLKGGAGKHYHASRLFTKEPEEPPRSPDKSTKKTQPKKYNHFEFGEEDLKVDSRNINNRHNAKWNFEDFDTPEKPRARRQPQQERHIGWSDDEEEAKKPQVHHEHVPKARRDAAPHFEFRDEATPMAERVRPRDGNVRMGLYEDHVGNAAEVNSSAAAAGPAASEKMPLGNITNVNNQGHKKNFESSWEMTDESPSALDKIKDENPNRASGVPETRKMVAKQGTQPSWGMYAESPKDKVPKEKGIHISGDGMGGKKNTGEKGWWEY